MLKVSGTLRFVTNAYSSYYISIAIKTFNKNILYFEKFGTLVINISNANALPIDLLVRSFYLSIFFFYTFYELYQQIKSLKLVPSQSS